MNPLQSIPPKVRQVAYLVAALAGVVLGALQVGYASADAPQPTWVDVAFDVLGYLVVALGLTAASNLPSYEDVVEGDAPAPDVRGRHELGHTSLVTALIVVALVLLILFLLGPLAVR